MFIKNVQVFVPTQSVTLLAARCEYYMKVCIRNEDEKKKQHEKKQEMYYIEKVINR